MFNSIVSYIRDLRGVVTYGYTNTYRRGFKDITPVPEDKSRFDWKRFFRCGYEVKNKDLDTHAEVRELRAEARRQISKVRLASIITSVFIWWPAVIVGLGVCVLIDVDTARKTRDLYYYA